MEDAGESTSDSQKDVDWHTKIDIVIGPHPNLKPSQYKTIALDYGMNNDQATITTRRSLLFYTLKQLGLLPDQFSDSAKPNVQQIVLLNKDEVYWHLDNRSQ